MGFSKGLLWSVQKPGCRPSYILGTIHMNSVFFEKHQHIFQNLIRQCDAFAAEIDLDKMMSVPMGDLFILRSKNTWKHLLKENQFQKLAASCVRQFGIDLKEYQSFYPMLLIHLIMLHKAGEANAKSFDQSLWELARAEGLGVFGLEEIDQHFQAMYDFPIAEQLKMLKKLVLQSKTATRKLKRMIERYENEDIAFLYKESKRMLGGNRKGMLYDRNEIMAAKIMDSVLRQKCFFTFGAAHLYGAYGILKKLKNNGFELKPIGLSVVS